MRKIGIALGVGCMTLALHAALAGGRGGADAKEALQALQEYIGGWKGSGTKPNDASIWKETAEWSWRFKDKDVWLGITLPEGKHLKSAEVRFDPKKDKYVVKAKDKEGKEQVFEGELKKGKFTIERLDPETKETQRLSFNTAAQGIRYVMAYEVKPENRTLFNKQYQLSFTREGESFGVAAAKKQECVVTGGLGTSAVTYMGVTYWVCCSGCRDAFNDNPKKIVEEFLAKKKRGE